MMSSIDSTTKRKPGEPARGPLPRGPQRTLEEVRTQAAAKRRVSHEQARLRVLEEEEKAVARRIERERVLSEGEAARLRQKTFLDNDPRSLEQIVAQAIHDSEH